MPHLMVTIGLGRPIQDESVSPGQLLLQVGAFQELRVARAHLWSMEDVRLDPATVSAACVYVLCLNML